MICLVVAALLVPWGLPEPKYIARPDVGTNNDVGLVQSLDVPVTAKERSAVTAFHAAHARRICLTSVEREATPILVRYRALGSAVWRAGRWRLGQSTLQQVVDRLDAGLAMEPYLDRYRG